MADNTTTELRVEQALAELKQMFGRKGMFAPYITAGFDPDNDWQPLFIVNWVSNGVGHWTDKASTLTEAMDQVRQWHAEQAKES